MKPNTIILPAAALFLLAACGGSEPEPAGNGAEDFAARINGGTQPAPQGTVAPTIAAPRENAAEGAFSPGTATDPESATCNANLMGPYIGQQASEDTRRAVVEAADAGRDVRFIAFGSDYIKPDPTSSRLNLMLDRTGVIRDARCG